MIIGVPKEIKRQEYRVALTPEGAAEPKRDGHSVRVEKGAGEGNIKHKALAESAGEAIHPVP